MASGIFAILDDIAALMDDVAITTKVATRKTAAILGDDLAVNAEKATGFVSSRELPVLWAITKGSLLNKIIIVPAALVLSTFLPLAIQVILVIGGLYLAYEGAEKIIEYLFHRNSRTTTQQVAENLAHDPIAERAKIKSAVTTDFILSVEIIIIALGTVLDRSLTIQILTVSAVAILATVGVYGLVALIVRMDDVGYGLIARYQNKGVFATIGRILVRSLPVIIKSLSVIGTVALLLVSGGIFTHSIDFLHTAFPSWPPVAKDLLFGLLAGVMVVAIVSVFKKIYAKVIRR